MMVWVMNQNAFFSNVHPSEVVVMQNGFSSPLSLPNASTILYAMVLSPNALSPHPNAMLTLPNAMVLSSNAMVPSPNAMSSRPNAMVPSPNAMLPHPNVTLTLPNATQKGCASSLHLPTTSLTIPNAMRKGGASSSPLPNTLPPPNAKWKGGVSSSSYARAKRSGESYSLPLSSTEDLPKGKRNRVKRNNKHCDSVEAVVCNTCGCTPCEWVQFGSTVINLMMHAFDHTNRSPDDLLLDPSTKHPLPNSSIGRVDYKCFQHEKYGSIAGCKCLPIPNCIMMQIKHLYP
jgi:hypothetical protein